MPSMGLREAISLSQGDKGMAETGQAFLLQLMLKSPGHVMVVFVATLSIQYIIY